MGSLDLDKTAALMVSLVEQQEKVRIEYVAQGIDEKKEEPEKIFKTLEKEF